MSHGDWKKPFFFVRWNVLIFFVDAVFVLPLAVIILVYSIDDDIVVVDSINTSVIS